MDGSAGRTGHRRPTVAPGTDNFCQWRRGDRAGSLYYGRPRRGNHMSTDDEAKIMRAVGRRLKFKYPGREGVRRGTLRYREIARSAEGRTGAWYWTVVDVIVVAEDPEPWS